MLSDTDETHDSSSTRLIKIEKDGQNCGFKLTRSKWDPYPWVSSVDPDTPAEAAGLRPGDCILEVNGEDVIGEKIASIAEMVKSNEQVSLLSWNAGSEPQCSPESMCCGPMPTNLQRLSSCMSTILAFLECPVCLDTIPPPTYQCENGHLICIRCRARSEKCPICRLRYGRGRSLVADQVYNSLVDAFHLKEETSNRRASKIQEIFKVKAKPPNTPNIKVTPSSHTNKFLAKLIGKSTSVDNLSDDKPLNDGCSLKIKSLSNQDIFQGESPVVSRAGSVARLNQNNHLKPHRTSASCHGSFESIHLDLEVDVNSFYCPFSLECSKIIKDCTVMEHFQSTHDGPLIQFFKPHITITYKKILETRSICYVVKIENDTFIVKAELDDKFNPSDILLWTWFVGSERKGLQFEVRTKILSQDSTILFDTCNNVLSLKTMSYYEIRNSRKGVVFGGAALAKLTALDSDLIFQVDIMKKICDTFTKLT